MNKLLNILISFIGISFSSFSQAVEEHLLIDLPLEIHQSILSIFFNLVQTLAAINALSD